MTEAKADLGQFWDKATADRRDESDIARKNRERVREYLRKAPLQSYPLPYTCACGREGKLNIESAPGCQYLHRCPNCHKWHTLTVPETSSKLSPAI